MIRTILIDDEQPALKLMRTLLEKYFQNKFLILEECTNIKDAEVAIAKHNPDLIFLDIKMKSGNGFDLLKKIENINFDVIFTTAYSEYAIDAIKQSALDYLLKPISPAELILSIKKFEKKNQNKFELDRIRLLLENIESGTKEYPKIALPSSEGYELIKTTNIKYCVADINYTRIFLIDGRTILVSRTLKRIEEILPVELFLRPHKSYLVNLNFIKEYQNREGHFLILSSKEQIPISNRRKNEVLTKIL